MEKEKLEQLTMLKAFVNETKYQYMPKKGKDYSIDNILTKLLGSKKIQHHHTTKIHFSLNITRKLTLNSTLQCTTQEN